MQRQRSKSNQSNTNKQPKKQRPNQCDTNEQPQKPLKPVKILEGIFFLLLINEISF